MSDQSYETLTVRVGERTYRARAYRDTRDGWWGVLLDEPCVAATAADLEDLPDILAYKLLITQ